MRWGVLLGLCLAAMTGCKDKNPVGPGDSPSTVVFPVSNVSYTNHVQPLFNQACNYSGCHDDGAHQSPLKLTSWGNVVITLPGIVVPGKPDASDLVLRIQGTVGARMPPGVNGLNQNQIDGIRAWIVEGAKDN